MTELLAHLVGDYVLQNHWIALTKTSSSKAALLHVSLYILPFLFLTHSPLALLIIGGTHFVIDRFRLARYWVDLWGVGKSGKVLGWIMRMRGYELVLFGGDPPVALCWVPAHERNHGATREWLRAHSLPYIADAPPFLGVWLLILNDNILHMLLNHAALTMTP